MTTRFEVAMPYLVVTCADVKCGMTFGLPADWLARRREDHETFYCPRAHPQWFPLSPEEQERRDRVHEEIARTQRERREREREARRPELLERVYNTLWREHFASEARFRAWLQESEAQGDRRTGIRNLGPIGMAALRRELATNEQAVLERVGHGWRANGENGSG